MHHISSTVVQEDSSLQDGEVGKGSLPFFDAKGGQVVHLVEGVDDG